MRHTANNKGAIMKIYLIRHAKTEGNALGRYIGITDSPLCGEGIELARQAGGSAQLARVIVTPLARTQQTAKILFPNAVQRIVPLLAEMDFGDFENRSAADMENDAAYRAWVDGGCLGTCPNGESIAGFSARVCAAFKEELHLGQCSGQGELVFVVHGGVIMALLSALGRPQKGFYDWYLPNCACVKADAVQNGATGELTLENIEILERVRL